jgi:hypothetical protein
MAKSNWAEQGGIQPTNGHLQSVASPPAWMHAAAPSNNYEEEWAKKTIVKVNYG